MQWYQLPTLTDLVWDCVEWKHRLAQARTKTDADRWTGQIQRAGSLLCCLCCFFSHQTIQTEPFWQGVYHACKY